MHVVIFLHDGVSHEFAESDGVLLVNAHTNNMIEKQWADVLLLFMLADVFDNLFIMLLIRSHRHSFKKAPVDIWME